MSGGPPPAVKSTYDDSLIALCVCVTHKHTSYPDPYLRPLVSGSMVSLCTQHPAASPSPVSPCHSSGSSPSPLKHFHSLGSHSAASAETEAYNWHRRYGSIIQNQARNNNIRKQSSWVRTDFFLKQVVKLSKRSYCSINKSVVFHTFKRTSLHVLKSTDQCLVVNLLSDEFILTEGITSFSCDCIYWPLFHLLLHGTVQHEKRLTGTFLGKNKQTNTKENEE